MCIAKNALLKFSSVLLQMCAGNRKVHVVWSSIIKTKDDHINIRATVHNKITREMCIKYDWIFMDNSNINIHQLLEHVHLNRSGEEMFIQNMSETTKKL